jgi:hypothetical protein
MRIHAIGLAIRSYVRLLPRRPAMLRITFKSRSPRIKDNSRAAKQRLPVKNTSTTQTKARTSAPGSDCMDVMLNAVAAAADTITAEPTLKAVSNGDCLRNIVVEARTTSAMPHIATNGGNNMSIAMNGRNASDDRPCLPVANSVAKASANSAMPSNTSHGAQWTS